MRKRNKLWSGLIVSLILLNAYCYGMNPMENWHGVGWINKSGNHQFKAVFLTPPVYRRAKDDLGDLRFVDDQGRPMPYIIQSGSETTRLHAEIYESCLLQSIQRKNDRIIDFQVLSSQPSQDTAGNRLTFSLPGQDFLKHAEIYGSYDGDGWSFLGDASFYRVDGMVKNEFILDRRAKYGYYRVKLLDDPEELQVSGLRLVDEYQNNDWAQFQKRTVLSYRIENKADQTVIVFKNPDRLRISRIAMKADGDFKRRISVTGRNGIEIPTRDSWIYQFTFQNMQASRSDVQFLEPDNSQTFVLKIFNLSDRPVNIKHIVLEYQVDKAIFRDTSPGGIGSYRLYFGNSKANPPEYDMALFREAILREDQDLLKLARFEYRPEPGKPPSTIGVMPAVFNGVLGLVALVLVGILVRRLILKP